MKTYLASSVWLWEVPKEHIASNGNRQYTILIKAKSKRAVCDLVGGAMSLHHLNNFCGAHVAPEHIGSGDKRRAVSDIVQDPGVIYYEHWQDWFRYNAQP